jgi:prepilin-type processing-associated H-X9-DG protein
MHPDNPNWEYTMIRQTNSGQINVLKADGSVGGVVPNQHILATLNQFGKEGWEVIQGGPNPDASGVTYLLKRRV